MQVIVRAIKKYGFAVIKVIFLKANKENVIVMRISEKRNKPKLLVWRSIILTLILSCLIPSFNKKLLILKTATNK